MKTLIITEKPKVSQRIAQSIAQKYSVKRERGVTYYEISLNGDKIFVASAAGHLYSLTQENSGWGYPVFEIRWEPLYKIDKSKAYVKKYIEVLSQLGKTADEFYIATDYDIEGELLGYNALRFACMPKEHRVLRMKFSTLTGAELLNAFKNPGSVDLKLVDAGEARHIMDWFWGINTSRALTLAAKVVNRQFITISAGRVQTPALALLVQRGKEIRAFKPEKYWEIYADLDAKEKKVKAQHVRGRIFDESEARQILENSKSREALVKEVEKKEVRKPAPFPFDLGTLQTEAYRIFGFIPKKTQQIAQTLYEGGYISYPRTSSQKLPPAIGYERILRNLREAGEFRDYADAVLKKESLKPREGPKSDPAHPAIYPTGILPKGLSREAEKLYKLIVHRFFAVFGESLIREVVNVLCEIGREAFKLSGETTVEEGWNKLYPYIVFKEVEVPALKIGDILPVLKLYSSEKETQPPARFNPASLIKELERRGLGTKATRAEIVDTLYQREYIRGTQIETTELGNAVIAALEENVPAIISEELTRRFEERLENIQNGRESKESVLEEAKKELSRIMNEFKQKEKLIGEKLVKALEEKNRRKYVVGVCKCGGDLRIIKSKATGKIFIGCSNYPKCSTSYPLPQREGVRTTDKKCNTCGLPMVSVPFRRKRFLSCIDMNCKSKSAKRF